MTQVPEPSTSPQGQLRPTSVASLAIAEVIGLLSGWGLRRGLIQVRGTAPFVTWLQALALLFVAAVLGYLAWHTWQTIQVRRRRLDDNRAVSRLVLARASALVGALASGGYAGYGITWLGDASELADVQLVRCLVAAVGGLLMTAASLVLERACRVPSDEPGP